MTILIGGINATPQSINELREDLRFGEFDDGTVGLPAFRFAADQDTGLRRVGVNALALVTGGTDRVTAGPTGATVNGDLYAVTGNASTDRGVLIYGEAGVGGHVRTLIPGVGPGNLLLNFNGGNVGIGTSSPSTRLNVGSNTGTAGMEQTFSLTNFVDSNLFLRLSGTENADKKAVIGPTTPTALVFDTNATERMRITAGGTVRPGADNSQNLGEASFRWSTVFAGTGTINTSDEREKVWRGPMNEAEMRAAKRIIGELGMFQFIDSVAEKGDDARLHFGVRAQAAFAILKEEGLDWWRYAWCCHDKWDAITEPVFEEVTVEKTRTVTREQTDPETGETATVEVEETYEETEQRDTGEVRIVREAGDRYGIRSDQLAFWLIAAQAEIQRDLDARIAALEGQRK